MLKDSDPQATRAHWYPYVKVDDVHATVEKAKSLGSELFHGPVDVDVLRFAVLGDPQHATYGVISSPNPKATGLFVWDELHAADVEAAERYYAEVVGWTASSFTEGYDVFNAGDAMVGGVMQKNEDMPGAAWLSYLKVDDTDAATAKAQELGATLMLEPTTMENVGRYSVLADPTGAVFGLHKSAN